MVGTTNVPVFQLNFAVVLDGLPVPVLMLYPHLINYPSHRLAMANNHGRPARLG